MACSNWEYAEVHFVYGSLLWNREARGSPCTKSGARRRSRNLAHEPGVSKTTVFTVFHRVTNVQGPERNNYVATPDFRRYLLNSDIEQCHFFLFGWIDDALFTRQCVFIKCHDTDMWEGHWKPKRSKRYAFHNRFSVYTLGQLWLALVPWDVAFPKDLGDLVTRFASRITDVLGERTVKMLVHLPTLPMSAEC